MSILIVLPTFPNVPNVPGVPPLLRLGGGLTGAMGAVNSAVGAVDAAASLANSVIAPIGGLAAAALDPVNFALGSVNGALSAVNGAIGGALAGATGALSGAVAGLSGALGGLAGAASNLAGAVAGAGGAAIAAASGLVASVTSAIGTVSGLGGAVSTFASPNAMILTSDAPGVVQQGQKPLWGMFLNGNNILNPDNIIGFEYKSESKVASFPIERGGFASYDKVPLPYDARIEMTKGGSLASRSAFMQTLDEASKSLNLYTIVTPEVSIQSANIVHYDYRRTEKSGVILMTFSVYLQEIRVAGSPAFTNTTNPSGAAAQNGGTVQPSTPTPAQTSAINAAGPPQPTPPGPASAFA